jgi:hypothetical protein
MIILNVLIFFLGTMIGGMIMAWAAASGRKSFEEEFYRLNKKNE